MRLGKYGKILHYDNVSLGVGKIQRFILFEFKPLGGIIFNLFNTDNQDRFHNHAFSAICIQLKGQYEEEYFDNSMDFFNTLNKKIGIGIRYIPKNDYYHKITKSSLNAISITICGPWDKTWKEVFDNKKEITYTWGRKKL